jgi:WD40 repeat protein
VYHTQSWKMVNSFLVDMFDTAGISWAPNDANIIAWDNCINYKLLTFCPMRGLISKFEPYNHALGIKSVKYSNNSLFVAVGSFDEKVRLLNAKTWKAIGELDCSQTVVNTEEVTVFKEEDVYGNDRVKMVKSLENNHAYKINTTKVVSKESAPNQGVSVIEFSRDDSYIACKNDNMPYTIFIFNTSSLSLDSVVNLSCHVKMFKWFKNENRLCFFAGSNNLLFWKDSQVDESVF